MLDATQVLVTLVGLGLMGFVAWFFLGAPHRAGGPPPPAADSQPRGGPPPLPRPR